MISNAWVLFGLAKTNTNNVAEELRATSLANCKQILLGHVLEGTQIAHLAYDGRDGTSFLNQALLKLSQIDGVKRMMRATGSRRSIAARRPRLADHPCQGRATQFSGIYPDVRKLADLVQSADACASPQVR
jgi:hypothetical protein